jgi:hypothetical protein
MQRDWICKNKSICAIIDYVWKTEYREELGMKNEQHTSENIHVIQTDVYSSTLVILITIEILITGVDWL